MKCFGITFEGTFEGTFKNGTGKITYFSGLEYTGAWRGGKPSTSEFTPCCLIIKCTNYFVSRCW